MTEINKHLTNDFNNGLNTTQLQKEINKSNIGPECMIVLNLGLNVNIKFDNSLSNEEITTLDGLVSNHIPVVTNISDNTYTVNPQNPQINSSNYSLVSRFEFSGSESENINYIRVISNMDEEVTSYSIQVVNMDDMSIIAEKTEMANTTAELHDLGAINNLPSDPSVLEVYTKCTGNGKNTGVKIEQITIHLD